MSDQKQSSEELRIYRPDGFPELTVWAVKNSDRLIKYLHQTYTICTVLDQPSVFAHWRYRQRDLFAKSGNLMLMEPGEVHVTKRIVNKGDYFILQITPHLFEKFSKEMGSPSPPHFKPSTVSSEEALPLFRDFHLSVEQRAPQLERDVRLSRCAAFLLRHCTETQAKKVKIAGFSAVRKARDYILSHCESHISLDDLASAAELSRFSLLRSFRQEFGVPPHAFQLQARVAKARRRLASGESAEDLGFSDDSHFIRHFKRIVGVTPGQYAAAMRPARSLGGGH